MRYALLDDDLEYSQLQVETLEHRFPELSGCAEIVLTEKDFRERFQSEEAFDVDFFILDIMVQWADASEPILPPAEEVEGGYFRAGIRCLELIRKWKPAMPVVVHSALNAEQIASVVKLKDLSRHHLWILEKGEDEPLFACVGEILKEARRPGP